MKIMLIIFEDFFLMNRLFKIVNIFISQKIQ
jgi:hypothetical protein